ncbi:hypothetical protein BCV72DRAFT_310028 [Rhizopus microsporus var. microsporus]|uniref:Tc1-like transposase DDE domain-containing protein n=2 Tax=Rhizopus microsporus TaxID=58291 RepID=A0A2G4SKY7_RHIZD|nr:uncharacterized protein RHIMIDRAFT_240535 [Rhizopus microsporus ATCC 52813]ORE01449.1 hypothetical protein BCV72DRAFT_310028 [Rhizopus microsporus var. microsporus]PHZ09423.1 hypothetical protein RHIMIDRAFT_240535 [Rhizopus microsporus ATCC 52813]
MEGIPDDEDDGHFNTAVAMGEIDLEATPLPNMIWTPAKYKPKDVAQFISLLQNKNLKWKKMVEQSYLVTNQPLKLNIHLLKKHPTCIVKDATESLCEAFQGLTINESTVYRHIIEKLEFTLTRTQARFVNRNSNDTLEQRRQFIEDIDAMNEENFYKKRCTFVDESGFKKNMVRPVAWSRKDEPAEVDIEAEGANLSILGCMSAYGLIALSQHMEKNQFRQTLQVNSDTKSDTSTN